jgi:hypothetical protein
MFTISDVLRGQNLGKQSLSIQMGPRPTGINFVITFLLATKKLLCLLTDSMQSYGISHHIIYKKNISKTYNSEFTECKKQERIIVMLSLHNTL